VAALAARGVAPVSRGRVIVATWEPHEAAVLEVIRDLRLELRVILNKGAVMVLPAGVDKGTGLAAALRAMAIDARRAVGVGDAENDLDFLGLCGLSVAVANALPRVKARVDRVTRGDHGDGVVEIIDSLGAGDASPAAAP
jgi:hydroxymethylpyrimidine pyrophosphatase-like HAD family hydrolase